MDDRGGGRRPADRLVRPREAVGSLPTGGPLPFLGRGTAAGAKHDYHDQLVKKYKRAAHRPWFPLDPNPPDLD